MSFTVMVTIHGPKGWFDVIDEHGETVAVCPKSRFAKHIAEVLTREDNARIDMGPNAPAEARP